MNRAERTAFVFVLFVSQSYIVTASQIMLDEDIRAGVVDKKFTLDRVINDRTLKQAQQELKAEGKLR
jgi:hypothetical protein